MPYSPTGKSESGGKNSLGDNSGATHGGKSPPKTRAHKSAARDVTAQGPCYPEAGANYYEGLGSSPIQILEWLDRVGDVDIVTKVLRRCSIGPGIPARISKKKWRRQ